MAKPRLRAELTLDDSKFQAGIRRAQISAKDFSSRLQSLTAGAVGLGTISAAAGATAVVLAGLVKRATELGGAFSDLAARTSAPVSKLVVLSTAFENAGLNSADLGRSINLLQKKLAEGSNAFGRLGLNIKELQMLSPDEQFMRVGKAISEVGDAAEQTQIAMELFGRSGAELLAVFKDDKALENAASVLGSMPDILEKNAELFDRFSDNVGNLTKKLDAFAVGVASVVVPQLDGLLQRLVTLDTAKVGQGVGAGLMTAIGSLPGGMGIKMALNAMKGKDKAAAPAPFPTIASDPAQVDRPRFPTISSDQQFPRSAPAPFPTISSDQGGRAMQRFPTISSDQGPRKQPSAWQALQASQSSFERLQKSQEKIGGSVFLAPSAKSAGGVRRRGESKEEFRARMDAAKRGEKTAVQKQESLETLVQRIADSLEGK